MRIDLARSLRRLRPDAFRGTLRRRAATELPFAERAPLDGGPLLPDTTVYIDALEDAAPASVNALLSARVVAHIDIALAEFAHGLGRLDPVHPGTPAALAALRDALDDIPLHRVESASSGVVVEAGILAGLLFRLGHLARGLEVAALNDATIFLHALERGYTVLTRNVRDFDLLGQVVPAGRVLFYHRSS